MLFAALLGCTSYNAIFSVNQTRPLSQTRPVIAQLKLALVPFRQALAQTGSSVYTRPAVAQTRQVSPFRHASKPKHGHSAVAYANEHILLSATAPHSQNTGIARLLTRVSTH